MTRRATIRTGQDSPPDTGAQILACRNLRKTSPAHHWAMPQSRHDVSCGDFGAFGWRVDKPGGNFGEQKRGNLRQGLPFPVDSSGFVFLLRRAVDSAASSASRVE